MRVLGISIGTRRNGFAVTYGTELESACIYSLCERWSQNKMHALLSQYKRYIKRYRITIVVVKIPKQSHFSKALKQLISALDAYVKSHGCMIEYVTIEQIKQRAPTITNRIQLREFAVSQYPELIHEKHKDVRNKQPYYMKLFEATVIAYLTAIREHL